MNPKANPEQSLRVLLPVLHSMQPEYQAIVTRIIADEPIPGSVLAEIVGKSRGWVKDHMPRIKSMLADVAVVDSHTGHGGGYMLRMLTTAQIDARKADAQTIRFPSKPAAVTIPTAKTDIVSPPALMEAAEKPHKFGAVWFVLPWLSAVDLRTVIAVETQGGRLMIQLANKGFMRGPVSPDSEHIAADMIAALTKLPGARAIVYGQPEEETA